MYVLPSCVQCNYTKRALEGAGVSYESIDLSQNPEAYEMVTEELGYLSAPVVVTSTGEHWSGFQPEKISNLAAA